MLKLIYRTNWLPFIVWGLALIIRLYGVSTPAQPYDIGTFHAWGNHLLSLGPREFFGTIWSDYLPLPILMFGPVAWLSGATGMSFAYLFKLIMAALELGLIYFLSRQRRAMAPWPIYLLLLSPALIGDTAFWGQIDTLPALLGLLSLSTLSPVLFGLSVALKPIMLLAAPVLWLLSLKKMPWYRFPLLASLIFLLTGVPTGGWQFFPHLWSRVMDQVHTYPYASINAWNLWSLVPQNVWVNDSTSVLGLSAHTLGLTLFFSLAFLTLRAWHLSGRKPQDAYRVIGTILVLFYAVTTRMHERHLLFGLPFLTLASSYQPWLLFPLALLTGAFTLNLYAAFYWVAHAQTWPLSGSLIALTSWVTLLSALTLSAVWNWPQFFRSAWSRLKANHLLAIVLLLAALLRLSHLSYPQTYIFDEVYHAFTAREYLHNHLEAWEWWTTPPPGVAYEWTHPPLAKYGMVLGMLLFGENSFGWRLGSALAGILSVWGVYALARALKFSRSSSVLAAFLVATEGLHLAQSRLAMNDIYLLAFLLWSFYFAVKSRWKLSSIFFGLALASKWSAVYGLVPLAFLYLYLSRPQFSLFSLLRYTTSVIRLILISLFVYILSFAPFILAGHTWAQLWELHRQMWYYHTHLVATHAYQSEPWQWIFALRPVWYHVEYGPLTRNIYAQANPLVLYLGLAAFILQWKKLRTFSFAFLAVCYLVFTLPWVFSPRIMFFYHYLPSSVFLCLILASWLAGLSSSLRFRIVFLLCLSGLLISPLIFGFPMPPLYWDALFKIFPSWR